jgi:hypothetical protein
MQPIQLRNHSALVYSDRSYLSPNRDSLSIRTTKVETFFSILGNAPPVSKRTVTYNSDFVLLDSGSDTGAQRANQLKNIADSSNDFLVYGWTNVKVTISGVSPSTSSGGSIIDQASSPGKSSSTGAIVGGVVGGIAGNIPVGERLKNSHCVNCGCCVPFDEKERCEER